MDPNIRVHISKGRKSFKLEPEKGELVTFIHGTIKIMKHFTFAGKGNVAGLKNIMKITTNWIPQTLMQRGIED